MKNTKTYGYEVRNADNKVVLRVLEYDTQKGAELFAEKKREEIRRHGWAMTVHVVEKL